MSVSSTQEVSRALLQLQLVTREQLDESLAALESPSPDDLLAHLERRSLLSPYQIAKLERGDRAGFFLGRFKLVYKIAAGTFARVFRGVDTLTGDSVAVKVLRGRHTLDPENIRHFQREARLMQSLQHPNIARMLEVATDSTTSQHYIAMEFVEGGNLREFMKIRGRIGPEEVRKLGCEMVEGLRYALSKNVTHRDIKPTNILISAAGNIKWVDFGLAGVVERTAGTVSFSTEQRTVDYAGLEKSTGAPKGDPRSDIFFLGNVFFHMLTGEPALAETKDRNARMLRTRFDQVKPFPADAALPRDLTSVVEKMLAFRPDQRYQNYDSLLRDLEAIRSAANAGDGRARGSGEPPRIVIVHRNQQVQDLLRAKLMDCGYQVVLTTDMQRAVNLTGLKPADCLVIDLDTTGQDGIDGYKRIVERTVPRAGVCAAVFLANDSQVEWTKALNGNLQVTLKKPLTLGPVYKAVRHLVPTGE